MARPAEGFQAVRVVSRVPNGHVLSSCPGGRRRISLDSRQLSAVMDLKAARATAPDATPAVPLQHDAARVLPPPAIELSVMPAHQRPACRLVTMRPSASMTTQTRAKRLPHPHMQHPALGMGQRPQSHCETRIMPAAHGTPPARSPRPPAGERLPQRRGWTRPRRRLALELADRPGRPWRASSCRPGRR